MDETITALQKQNNDLKEENESLKVLLQKYTDSHNKYYQKNKDVINDKAKERLKKLAETNPEKIKEYRRNAYLKRKEKQKNIINETI